MYRLIRDISPTAAAEVITVQQPASGSKNVRFKRAYIYAAVACDFTFERDGTVASSTAATPTPMNANIPAAVATGWVTSNVGTGTVVDKRVLAAGGYMEIDLTQKSEPGGAITHPFQLVGDGTGKNFSIRTSSITGRVVMWLEWEEIVTEIVGHG